VITLPIKKREKRKEKKRKEGGTIQRIELGEEAKLGGNRATEAAITQVARN